MTDAFICVTCGTQYAPTDEPPAACIICDEERQYVPVSGQKWTTLPELSRLHAIAIRQEGELIGIGSSPNFGIGQRALLVRGPHGNVLWDCISLVDPVMVELIKGLGGLSAIAISHPHYYTTMLQWSRAFGGIPVYVHARDREWVMYDGPELVYWTGETREIAPGMTLIRAGGHFEGGTILHWAAGAERKGALLTGDLIQVVADRKTVGFMRSYPNFIPLGEAAVRQIAQIVEPWRFDAIYGAFLDRVIPTAGREAFDHSVKRHLHYLAAPAD
jgi:hypothetical protein